MTPLDELGMAITNAGYTWTPEMRKAYEKGAREQNRALQKEREACAKLCEEILEPWLLKEYIDETTKAIRARGKNGG